MEAAIAVFLAASLSCGYFEPPLQCQGGPPAGSTIFWFEKGGAPRGCGWHACSKPEVVPCKIWIQRGLDFHTTACLLRHEGGHCRCRWWLDD